jgi:hypothetical protein
LSSTDPPKTDTDDESDYSFQSANPSHFESTRPPWPNGDERFRSANGEVRYQRNNRRGNDCRNSGHKEKGDDGDQRPYCSRKRPGNSRDYRLTQPLFGSVQSLSREYPDE